MSSDEPCLPEILCGPADYGDDWCDPLCGPAHEDDCDPDCFPGAGIDSLF